MKENARKRQAPSALGNSSLFEAAAKRRPGPNKHGPMVSAVLLPVENQCLTGSVLRVCKPPEGTGEPAAPAGLCSPRFEPSLLLY